MTYEYPWYVMLALMIVAGAVVFLVCRTVDLALEWLLDRMAARRDRQLAEVPPAAQRAAESLQRMADEMRKVRKHDDRG